MVHEVFRAEELGERRLRITARIALSLRSKGTARGTYLPPEASWLNYADAVEVRIVVAAVLAVADDAVLVAHHLLKLCRC
jgi:hypothetical protein